MQLKTIQLTIFILVLFTSFSHTQPLWTDSVIPESELVPSLVEESKTLHQLPTSYRLLTLNHSTLEDIFENPSTNNNCLDIPLPSGGFECFEIQPSSVMHPDLASKYPEIQTFAGRSIHNPSSTIRMVWAFGEFHVMASTEKGALFIDKVNIGSTPYYINYYRKDLPREAHICETEHPEDLFKKDSLDFSLPETNSPHAIGTELRTYRLAMAVTGEVTVDLGGVNAAMTQVTNMVSDLNVIFERELAVHLELIPNNDTLIFPDPNTDPYSGNGLGSYLDDNIAHLDTAIGVANFDIGHVLNPTSGGVAYVGVFCNSYKAGGTSPNNLGTLAHEIGHQMGAYHTFNYCNGTGGGYEPGSGNTIMSYWGLCGGNNMPGGDLLQFHAYSYQQIVEHIYLGGGNTCGDTTVTNNNPPSVSVPNSGFTIPAFTPFNLTGSATDDGGSAALTYLWEQYDLGVNSTPPYNPTGPAPIFRAFPYSSDSVRTFPELTKIIDGISDIGETLPTYSRDLNFRLMVHDNHPDGGGVDYGELQFHVDENAGPFEVTVPNGPSTVWSAGQMRTIEWDVANTDIAPVSCATVDILASFDGGYTYPDTLAMGVPNDGSQAITTPDSVGTQTRIKIAAADNIFFDISDENFEILPASTNDFLLEIDTKSKHVCSEDSATYEIDIIALGVYNSPVNLTLAGLPTGIVSDLPASVPATTSFTLTLSNLNAIAEGHYPMTFTASESGGSIEHSDTIYLVIQGTPESTPGNSMNFDGDDYISIPDIGGDYQFGNDQDFSVEFWVKTILTTNNKVMVAKKDWSKSYYVGWLVTLRFGQIRFVVADGTDRIIVTSLNAVNDGEWHHVAVVLNRSGTGLAQIFIDGVLEIDKSPVEIGSVNNNLDIGIGADSKNAYEFEGQIEEVRTWGKALTPAEIRENMHRSLDTCLVDLVSCYQFNESSGDVLDLASFYDGTVTGATRITSTCPIGTGTANSQTETNGIVMFAGTDFTADYITQDSALVTATKINLPPFGNSGIGPSEVILDNQYWAINRYEQNGNINANLTFGTNEDITALDESDPTTLKLYYRVFNSDGDWIFLTDASSASNSNNTVTFSNIPNYGQFLIARSVNPLPLELVNFRATPFEKSIELVWWTEQEVGVEGFEIFRSSDGGHSWENIGWVESKNTLEQNQYRFHDEQVLENILYYYQLKIKDLDGQFAFSNIETAKINGNGNILFYPNPTKELLHVHLGVKKAQEVQIRLLNINGVPVLTEFRTIGEGEHNITLNVASFPAGLYIAEIKIGQDVYFEKILLRN